jgi:hypothetical protein
LRKQHVFTKAVAHFIYIIVYLVGHKVARFKREMYPYVAADRTNPDLLDLP